MHYRLIKHGRFYSHRDNTDDMSVFDFVGPTHTNPVVDALNSLMTMLLDPMLLGRSHLSLLLLKLGNNMHE